MITKPVIVSHGRSELLRITGGIDSHIPLEDIRTVTGTKLRTEDRIFAHKWFYWGDVVLQRWIIVLNNDWEVLVSSEGNLPPETETLLISGSGNKNFRVISSEKLHWLLWDDKSWEVFAITETSAATGTYGFIVKVILWNDVFTSKTERTLTWKSSDDLKNNGRITVMERNLLDYFSAQLGF